MRRAQQNHMHHMETAASEMQALQVRSRTASSTLCCIPITRGLLWCLSPKMHPRTQKLSDAMTCAGCAF